MLEFLKCWRAMMRSAASLPGSLGAGGPLDNKGNNLARRASADMTQSLAGQTPPSNSATLRDDRA